MRRYCHALSQNLANQRDDHSKISVRNFEVSGLVDGCAPIAIQFDWQLQQHLGRNGWWSNKEKQSDGSLITLLSLPSS